MIQYSKRRDDAMKKLIRNAIQCNFCGEVIESRYGHDYVKCSCGRVAVDGGLLYARRTFMGTKDDYTGLSVYEEDGGEE